jgi:hypothetical protein
VTDDERQHTGVAGMCRVHGMGRFFASLCVLLNSHTRMEIFAVSTGSFGFCIYNLQDELEVKLAAAPERIHAGGSQRGDQIDAQIATIGDGSVQCGALGACRVRGVPGWIS